MRGVAATRRRTTARRAGGKWAFAYELPLPELSNESYASGRRKGSIILRRLSEAKSRRRLVVRGRRRGRRGRRSWLPGDCERLHQFDTRAVRIEEVHLALLVDAGPDRQFF